EKLGELGLLGVTLSESEGGAGLDYLAYAIAMERNQPEVCILWSNYECKQRNGSDAGAASTVARWKVMHGLNGTKAWITNGYESRSCIVYIRFWASGIAGQALWNKALDCAIHYAAQRQAFGSPILNLQTIQLKLADMELKIESARLLTWKAAMLKDAGQNYTKEAALAEISSITGSSSICFSPGYTNTWWNGICFRHAS
ncbi:short-chain specific acyl-CoA dehydrogenase, mitochondrial, partial [Caerostris extrusa]